MILFVKSARVLNSDFSSTSQAEAVDWIYGPEEPKAAQLYTQSRHARRDLSYVPSRSRASARSVVSATYNGEDKLKNAPASLCSEINPGRFAPCECELTEVLGNRKSSRWPSDEVKSTNKSKRLSEIRSSARDETYGWRRARRKVESRIKPVSDITTYTILTDIVRQNENNEYVFLYK